MKHPMRRADRQLPEESTVRLLEEAEYGVLSTCGPDNIPYGIPLSYAIDGRKLYFHGACEGRKHENIAYCNRVSFCVVGRTHPLADVFSTNYESVIASGAIHICRERDEKIRALRLLIDKYAPENMENGYRYAEYAADNVCILCMELSEIIGKSRTSNGQI